MMQRLLIAFLSLALLLPSSAQAELATPHC